MRPWAIGSSLVWNTKALAGSRGFSESLYISAGLKASVGFSVTGNSVCMLDLTAWNPVAVADWRMCEKNMICKKQLKIGYNKRGSASKCFSTVTHLHHSGYSQVLSSAVSQEQQIHWTELWLSLLGWAGANCPLLHEKKKLAVVFACYTELSTWIVSNCSLSICKKIRKIKKSLMLMTFIGFGQLPRKKLDNTILAWCSTSPDMLHFQ